MNHHPQQSLLKAEPPKKVSNPEDSLSYPQTTLTQPPAHLGKVKCCLTLTCKAFSDVRTVTLMALKSPIPAFLHTNRLPTRHGEETRVDPRVWKCRLASPPTLALELGHTTATAPVPLQERWEQNPHI